MATDFRLVRGSFGIWLLVAAAISTSACKSRGKAARGAGEGAITTVASAITTPTIQVQYRNGDAAAPNDNQVKPHFKIKNAGTGSVSLSTLKVRYWYTIESGSPEQIWVDFAQVGNSNVSGRVVRLPAPRTGADRYLEVSFAAAAGSLGAGVTSGEVQMRFNKMDWSVYNESNDYSYQNTTSYVTSSAVTLYWNGMLIWGTEPAISPNCDVGVRARVLYKPGDPSSPADNHIKPQLQLVNTGFSDIPLREVKIRYWFTKETGSPEQGWVDYAQIGNNKVTTSFASPQASGATADRYFEVGFTDTAGTLLAGASTGEIQLRFNKSDWSNYNETNDASYDATRTEYQPTLNVTAYRNGLLLWGQEPAPSATTPGQTAFVEGTLVRQPGGGTTSIVGTQTFSSSVPFSLPLSMPVSEGNLGNQNVSLVLTTTAGSVTCTYRGAASSQSPTSDAEVALGRVAVFGSCGTGTCPTFGDSVFITGISLTVNGSDPNQPRTTVTLHQQSPNDPVIVSTPITDDNDPTFRIDGDATSPVDPNAISDTPTAPPSLPPDVNAMFTPNMIDVGHVDTVDPTIIFQ